MRIADWVRNSVAYVGVRRADGTVDIRGTGFFVAKPVPGYPIEETESGLRYLHGMFMYFVTARHVIDNVRSLGLQDLVLRVNLKQGGSAFIPARLSNFVVHPDPTVDLAMIHTDDGLPDYEINPWIVPPGNTCTQFLFQHDIGVGSPLSIVGLFHYHAGSERNLPIVRTGNVAAMVEEKIPTKLGPMDAFLIEARSIGGLSGSPVFANTGHKTTVLLMGVMHGHFDQAADGVKVNVGIGIVTPVAKLEQLLDLEEVVLGEKEVLERQRARDSLTPQ